MKKNYWSKRVHGALLSRFVVSLLMPYFTVKWEMVSWWMEKKIKARAIGRLMGDVTKLFQTQQRAYPSLFRGAHKVGVPGVSILRFKITRVAMAVEKQPRRRRRRKKNATRRRVSRIVLASVVNVASRRRRGLTVRPACGGFIAGWKLPTGGKALAILYAGVQRSECLAAVRSKNLN